MARRARRRGAPARRKRIVRLLLLRRRRRGRRLPGLRRVAVRRVVRVRALLRIGAVRGLLTGLARRPCHWGLLLLRACWVVRVLVVPSWLLGGVKVGLLRLVLVPVLLVLTGVRRLRRRVRGRAARRGRVAGRWRRRRVVRARSARGVLLLWLLRIVVAAVAC